MKTLHLIGLLTENEKVNLLERLKAKKRKSLYNLFKAINNNKSEKPDKEFLYKSTFSEPYVASKDYLLRNELRLLNIEIESFIADAENKLSKSPLFSDILMLERMLRSGKTEAFQNLFNDAERVALKNMDFKNLMHLYDLVINYYVKFQEVSVSNYELVLAYLGKKRSAFRQLIQEVDAEVRLRQNFSLKVIQSLDEEKYQQVKRHAETQSVASNFVADYLNQYAETYVVEGQEKIDLYKSLLKKQPKVAKVREERLMDISSLYGSLALTLFLAHDYKEADKNYLLAIKSSGGKPYLDLYFNYCVNALLIGKHREVVNVYEKYYNEINTNDKLKYRFRYFTAIAYLMMGKADTAFKMLDHEITQRPVTEYYYYRMVYAMVYFQKGDYENAERELENIMQSFRFRATAKQEDKPLVKLLQKLVMAESYLNQKEKYKNEIQKISKEIDKNDKDKSGFSTVIYGWLVGQVKIRMTSK